MRLYILDRPGGISSLYQCNTKHIHLGRSKMIKNETETLNKANKMNLSQSNSIERDSDSMDCTW